MADILKGLYPQKAFNVLAYHGARILGGKFKRRFGGPEYRVRRYAPHPLMALMEQHDHNES